MGHNGPTTREVIGPKCLFGRIGHESPLVSVRAHESPLLSVRAHESPLGPMRVR